MQNFLTARIQKIEPCCGQRLDHVQHIQSNKHLVWKMYLVRFHKQCLVRFIIIFQYTTILKITGQIINYQNSPFLNIQLIYEFLLLCFSQFLNLVLSSKQSSLQVIKDVNIMKQSMNHLREMIVMITRKCRRHSFDPWQFFHELLLKLIQMTTKLQDKTLN